MYLLVSLLPFINIILPSSVVVVNNVTSKLFSGGGTRATTFAHNPHNTRGAMRVPSCLDIRTIHCDGVVRDHEEHCTKQININNVSLDFMRR